MNAACKRFVWLPLLLTAVCAVSYLAPISQRLFTMHLERLSGIGAPAFVVFLGLSGLTDFAPMPYSVRNVINSALLVVVLLCWFTFILLPFWSEFRVAGLSSRSARILFAVFGVLITAVCWLYLGGWRTVDE
jgi:hypothetical protein